MPTRSMNCHAGAWFHFAGFFVWVAVLLAADSLRAQTDSTNAAPRPLTLEEAYDRALATDQSIKIAWTEIRKADLLPWSALTRLGPRVNASANYTNPQETIGNPTSGGPVIAETWRADIVVQQPLIDLTLFPAYRAGKLSAQAARLAHQFTIRSVLFGVATAYFNVLKQAKVVTVDRQTLELAQQQLEQAQNRLSAGTVTKTDVLRAQVSLERARRTLTEAENTRLATQKVLSSVLNLPDLPLVVQEPPDYPVQAEPLETLQLRAGEQREDLRVAGLTIEQNQQHRQEVKAQYLPRIVAQWSQQWVDPANLSTPNDFWQAGVAFQLPLFTGGQRELDLKRTRFDITQAQLSRENLAKSIEVDVKSAWLTARTFEQTLKALRAEVAAADENYRNLESQYQAGAATSLEVSDALNNLNTARTDLAVQTYDYQVALRNLERVTGEFQQARVSRLKR
jgi:outer membrane protein